MERPLRVLWQELSDRGLKEAWEDLLERFHRPETIPIAARGQTATCPDIRGAVARWMVARGLDAESAEVMAAVEHQGWFSGRVSAAVPG